MLTGAFVVTPGAYYGFSYWLAAVLYVHLRPLRFHRSVTVLILAAALPLMVVYVHVSTNVPVVWFLPGVVLVFCIISALIVLVCRIPLEEAGYQAVRAFILAEFAASFEWQMYFFSTGNWSLEQNWLSSALFLLVCHALVYSVAGYVENAIEKNATPGRFSRKDFFSAAAIGAAVYLLSNMSYAFPNTPFSSDESADIFTIRTLVDFGGIVILMANHLQLIDHQNKLEMQKLRSLVQLQSQTYQVSQRSMDVVNQRYHDLKHQISVLKERLSAKDSLEYLENIEDEIRVYEVQNRTGNRTLDAVLSAVGLRCSEAGIQLTCVADGPALDFMDPIDLSTLFGNLLDNALEAVAHLENKEMRGIHLSVSRKKHFVSIRTENAYDGQVHFRQGLPISTKANSDFHGFGMKSVRSITEAYGGSLTVRAEHQRFEARILIPLPNPPV